MTARTDFRSVTLYVARHGETEDNIGEVITAQADSPLTPRGREQAGNKGHVLADIAGHQLSTLAFIASPLHRACVTMELMRDAAGLPVTPYQTDPRLMEMNFGDWTKIPEGHDHYTSAMQTAHDSWNLVCPNGESQQMVHARVGRFLETINEDSVIVCHARVFCMIRSHVLRLSPEDTMQHHPSNYGVLRLKDGAEELFGGSA